MDKTFSYHKILKLRNQTTLGQLRQVTHLLSNNYAVVERKLCEGKNIF